MKKWLWVMFCGVAVASDYPRVDQAMARYDERVAQLRAEFARLPAAPGDKAWVRAKLRHMAEVDQYLRNFSVSNQSRGFTPEETRELDTQTTRRYELVDGGNTADLKALLKTHHWITISEFGAEADRDAFLLVQHADRDPAFQREVLERLEPLVARGETSAANYAYLLDRVATSYQDPEKRQKQRFGTQGRCTGPGTWEPYPVEEPEKLDDRRKQVGLMPMAEYRKFLKDLCHESQDPTPP